MNDNDRTQLAINKLQIDKLIVTTDEIKQMLQDHSNEDRKWKALVTLDIQNLMIDKRVRGILVKASLAVVSLAAMLVGIWKGLLPFLAGKP